MYACPARWFFDNRSNRASGEWRPRALSYPIRSRPWAGRLLLFFRQWRVESLIGGRASRVLKPSLSNDPVSPLGTSRAGAGHLLKLLLKRFPFPGKPLHPTSLEVLGVLDVLLSMSVRGSPSPGAG